MRNNILFCIARGRVRDLFHVRVRKAASGAGHGQRASIPALSSDMAVSPLPLLRLLADGEFHSGRDLGAALGVSRGAVWHRVRSAETTGVRIFKLRGRGYKLARPLDLLAAQTLALLARRCSPPLSIEVVDECASTSSVLLERSAAGAPGGSVVACEHQTAGRGRRGNRWFSAAGGSLAFSL